MERDDITKAEFNERFIKVGSMCVECGGKIETRNLKSATCYDYKECIRKCIGCGKIYFHVAYDPISGEIKDLMKNGKED